MARADSRNLPIRVTAEVHERLVLEAKDRGLSLSKLGELLIERGLDQLLPLDETVMFKP